MIRVTFNSGEDGVVSSFKMTGHADSAPYGSDIVCAACSVLAISTVNELGKVAKQQPRVVSNDDEGGYLAVSGIGADHDSQLLVRLLVDGLKSTAESYSQYLTVKMN